MNTFTDIGQFRTLIHNVKSNFDYQGQDESDEPIYRHEQPYPTLPFRGTVKLHGSNAGIVLYKDNHIEYQSRERVLSITQDNAGFMLHMLNVDVKSLFDNIPFNDNIAIFGEWCGSSIQKGVAITNLPKMWVIFAVKVDNVYQDMSNFKHLKMEDNRIFNILQFPTFNIDIDFEHPEIAQNKLVELTIDVETQCPVGKYFGVDGVGEGIVWEHINGSKRYIFKVKGEKHQSSKIKKLVSVDVEELNTINEFVDYALTESRLKQGVDKLRENGVEIDVKSTGAYLKWIANDVMKEEMDTIVKNQINVKKVGGVISQKARHFWLTFLNSEAGIK